MEFIILLGIVAVLWVLYQIKQARKRKLILAQYMAFSGATRDDILSDKGVSGEFAIYKLIRELDLGGYVLANLYVPYKGATTEIDLMWIHKTGVYVIESKNYSGSVYGYEDTKNWAQYLGGKKYSFYNPIKQNKTHMNVLAANGVPEEHMQSIIVFGAHTTLKKVTVSDAAPPIITLEQLPKLCRKLIRKRKDVYTETEVSDVANHLFRSYALASEETKKQHIERIQEKYGTPV